LLPQNLVRDQSVRLVGGRSVPAHRIAASNRTWDKNCGSSLSVEMQVYNKMCACDERDGGKGFVLRHGFDGVSHCIAQFCGVHPVILRLLHQMRRS
jgi:hypothetical protein